MADVAARDLLALVEGLPHDRVEALALLGGGRREAGAERVPCEGLRIEPGALGGALDDARDGTIAQALAGDAPVPVHAVEDGPVVAENRCRTDNSTRSVAAIPP